MKSAIPSKLLFALLLSGAIPAESTSDGVAVTDDHNLALRNSSSPYLQQHADNPVTWLPYSPDLITNLQSQQKLVFLSIGYSTCHWCHVMNRESFQDAEVAQVLDRSFISVKMDREQYPDADQYYNDLLVLSGGTAGWPLSGILLPDGTPVWLGNYVKKERLLALLAAFAEHYERASPDIEVQAGIYRDLIIANTAASKSKTTIQDTIDIKQAGEELLTRQDTVYGGVRGEQKFPNPDNIEMLWWFYDETGDKRFETAALRHLDGMLEGTLYDPLYGGFFRYATSPNWTRPHFEKTLSDQAQLLWQYSKAYSRTKNSKYLAVALDIERFTSTFFRAELSFGYLNGLDSEYNGVDGGLYLFNDEGVCSQLGCARYATVNGLQQYMAQVPQDRWGELTVLRSDLGTSTFKAATTLKRDIKIITEQNAKMALALFALSRATEPMDKVFAAKAIKLSEWLIAQSVDLHRRRVDRQLNDIGYLPGTDEDIRCLQSAQTQLLRHKPEIGVFFTKHSEVLKTLKSDRAARSLICDAI